MSNTYWNGAGAIIDLAILHLAHGRGDLGELRPFASQALASEDSCLRIKKGGEGASNLFGSALASLFEVVLKLGVESLAVDDFFFPASD